MLVDAEKNTVLFSSCFAKDYKDLYECVVRFLNLRKIRHLIVPYTSDYWCRDFMPIQINKKRFVQFVYNPDYLRDKGMEKYLTDVDRVMNSSLKTMLPIDAEIIHCPIVLDGGNMTVCRGRDKAGEYTLLILMDKVFVENQNLSHAQIEDEIRKAIGETVRFLWLPWEGKDIDVYGHTDGFVRYLRIGEDGRPSVLVNLEPYGTHSAVLKNLLAKYCNIIEIHFSKDSECNWAPMNFIHTDKGIVIPGIGEPHDKDMLQQICACFDNQDFPQYTDGIIQVQMLDFVEEWGGALNCLSWTIKM